MFIIYKIKFGENTILIYNVDFNKILTSNKVFFSKTGFKYFIGYKYGKKIRPLCVIFPKMSSYRRDFDEIKYVLFW